MAKELSTSPVKAISQFRKGASFVIKTTTGDYAIDFDTAQRLSELVVASNELRFVKVNTEQGQVVLNTSSIMAIAVNDSDARRNVEKITWLLEQNPEMSREDIAQRLNSTNVFNGNRAIPQDVFDYLYDVATEGTGH